MHTHDDRTGQELDQPTLNVKGDQWIGDLVECHLVSTTCTADRGVFSRPYYVQVTVGIFLILNSQGFNQLLHEKWNTSMTLY